MAPPLDLLPSFPATELPARVQTLPFGKQRKPADRVDLADCTRVELTQFRCEVERRTAGGKGEIVCAPVVRSFRR